QVVVVAFLVSRIDVWRIMHEQEDSLFICTSSVQLLLKPLLLTLLIIKARIDEQGIDQDKTHPLLLKSEKIIAKTRAVFFKKSIAYLLCRHPFNALVSHVMVTRQHMHRHLNRFDNVFEMLHRLVKSRQRKIGRAHV